MIILGKTLQEPIMTGDSTEDQILEAGWRYMNRQLFFCFLLLFVLDKTLQMRWMATFLIEKDREKEIC